MLRHLATRLAPAAMQHGRVLSTTAARGQVYGSILETIGNTPVVRVNNIAPAHVEMYVKCEYFNPLSSVKDRLALGIIEDAEASGELKPGMTVVEATSGNTGIAMAMVCAQKGYDCVICMAEPFSVERRKIMRSLGAKVIITPAADRGSGMVKKAKELSKAHGWFLSRQFENEANWKFHAKTTGPEIVKDFDGKRLDYWVTGWGTGGTYHGAGMVIKEARPDVKIVVTEPGNAALITSGEPQEREADASPAKSHPAWEPHPIQGWTPDFIPKVLEDGFKYNLHDEIVAVTGPESIAASQQLARSEGIFTGISGGGSFACAMKVAEKAPEGSVILAMLPDTAERYMTTPLFADIAADMNEAEVEVSKSTPSFQLKPAA